MGAAPKWSGLALPNPKRASATRPWAGSEGRARNREGAQGSAAGDELPELLAYTSEKGIRRHPPFGNATHGRLPESSHVGRGRHRRQCLDESAADGRGNDGTRLLLDVAAFVERFDDRRLRRRRADAVGLVEELPDRRIGDETADTLHRLDQRGVGEPLRRCGLALSDSN